MIPDTFAFLKATRFWALVVITLAVYLKAKGWIGEAERDGLITLAGGFITVRTADRMSEQKVIAAGIATGEMKVKAVLPTVPPNTDQLA
jgi:hypothetical protein